MKRRILFVDDDPNILAAFQRNLRKRFEFDTALGAEEALALIGAQGPYAVVLSDMRMPGMDGVELLAQIRERSPDTVRMMLTGNADQQTAIDAVNRGRIFRFLNKPADTEALQEALDAALKQHELICAEREVLEGTLTGSVKLLTDVLGMVAPDALGRGQRLRDSIGPLARAIKAEPIWELELGALLSSIGSAAVPPHLLQKHAAGIPLSREESAVYRQIPQLGHDLLATIPRLGHVADIVLYQQKHYDGGGVPSDGLAEEAIPLGSRLLKILHDRLDLETDGVVKQRAFEVMQARAGLYDPALLVHCFECFGTFLINPLSAKLPVLTVHAAQLAPGQVVVSDINANSGVLLIGAGQRLTAAMVHRIRSFVEIGEAKPPFLVQQARAENSPT